MTTTENPLKINRDLAPLARPVASLRYDPRNARRHGPSNLDAIEASLRDHGQQKPIVITSDGVVRAGNGTLEAAMRIGATHVACVVYDGPIDRVERFAVADNRAAELASWDDDVLATVLRELAQAEDFDPRLVGFGESEFQRIVGDLDVESSEADGADLDESIADDVEMLECPACGHKFPK
jgi:ParB-like chromosome segregation protein Spo0J